MGGRNPLKRSYGRKKPHKKKKKKRKRKASPPYPPIKEKEIKRKRKSSQSRAREKFHFLKSKKKPLKEILYLCSGVQDDDMHVFLYANLIVASIKELCATVRFLCYACTVRFRFMEATVCP
ncbi:hypothetical protein EVA_08357 [gut metagenome]|uniref:Uncharacterized protein n=1 Tax=gut metagenome TaxID=749906 RepID=J9G8K8_9ZZZZ